MPRHINRTNVDPDTGSKSLFTDTQESSEFRSLHWNQIDSDLQHWNQVNFKYPHYNQTNAIPSLKLSQFQPPTQKRRHFRSSHSNQSGFGPQTKIKWNSTTQETAKSIDHHTDNKSTSIHALQPIYFWPIHTKKSILTQSLVSRQFRSRLRRQADLDAPQRKTS